jgi:hypothetical protein
VTQVPVPEGAWYFLGTLVTVVGTLVAAWMARRADKRTQGVADRVEETHHQLTTNHHVSDPPTLLDKVDSVHRDLGALREVVELNQARNDREHRELWHVVNRRRRWWRG